LREDVKKHALTCRRYWRPFGYAVIASCGALTGILSIMFVSRSPFVWQEMNSLLMIGPVALTVGMLCYAALTSTFREGVWFLALSFLISLTAELTGTHWAIPFGAYRYHADLAPKILGRVPLVIPLAWVVLAYPCVLFLRALRIRPNGSFSRLRLALKTALCALYLASMGLLLDPLAASVGAWTWQRQTYVLGIGMENFAGWLLVGIAIYGSFFLLRTSAAEPEQNHFYLDLGVVIFIAMLSLLAGYAAVRRLDHILPAALSCVLLAPYWVYGFVFQLRSAATQGARNER